MTSRKPKPVRKRMWGVNCHASGTSLTTFRFSTAVICFPDKATALGYARVFPRSVEGQPFPVTVLLPPTPTRKQKVR
jgi:hypothetical protein